LLNHYNERVKQHAQNGGVYHERGCYFYDTQRFGDALKDFQTSAQLGSDERDYSWFRAWLLQARLGQTDAGTRALADYLSHRMTGVPDDWPSKIGLFLTGKISEADLLAAAANPSVKVDREQHCEAWFYAGTKRLIDGDKPTAEDYYRKCIKTGITYFEEYQSAEAEMNAMSAMAK
jgi:lipoprotein NlpI